MDGLVVKISPMGFKTCFEIFGPDIWLDLDGKINYRDIVPVFYSSRGGSPLEIFVAKGRDIVPIDFIDRIVLAASETGELDRKMTEKLRTNLLEKYSKFTARGLNGKGNEYSKKLWME